MQVMLAYSSLQVVLRVVVGMADYRLLLKNTL
jgi:hypothetical protein